MENTVITESIINGATKRKRNERFTDYHAHFVYGVDDGAQTREEMYAMLDVAGV